MQLPLGALLHVWRLTCSCATSRSRPLTRRTSVRRSLVCLYAVALGCPPARLAPHLQLRDFTISSFNKAHLCSSFTRLLLYAGALGCPPARLAPHLQLRDYTISSFNKAHLCSSFTRLLLYAVALGCPSARLAPHLQLRDYTISS